MIAVKDNKQIKIEEVEKTTYLALGYDIAEADGNELKIIENAPGKSVPYAQYKEVMDKIAELEAEKVELLAEIDAINKAAK
jgi:hypothetical protein